MTGKRQQITLRFLFLDRFITKPLKLILLTISHFPIRKNTYIPMARLTDCILDAVDVFIASVW